MDIASVQLEYDVRIVASRYAGKVLVSPPVEAPIYAPATLAIIAQPNKLKKLVAAASLVLRPKLVEFRHLLARSIAGVAEVVVPPDSHLIGHTAKDLHFSDDLRAQPVVYCPCRQGDHRQGSHGRD
jgi:hypothetical protein